MRVVNAPRTLSREWPLRRQVILRKSASPTQSCAPEAEISFLTAFTAAANPPGGLAVLEYPPFERRQGPARARDKEKRKARPESCVAQPGGEGVARGVHRGSRIREGGCARNPQISDEFAPNCPQLSPSIDAAGTLRHGICRMKCIKIPDDSRTYAIWNRPGAVPIMMQRCPKLPSLCSDYP